MNCEKLFAKGFYCKLCGSMTAIKLENLGQVRCMGCDARYEFDKYAIWQLVKGETKNG